MDDKEKRNRSPQFPFISLERAIERARSFEGLYHDHPASIPLVAKLWGLSEKSSNTAQTIGALVAFGLLDDEGSLDRRKVRLTALAKTILKDARPGAAGRAIKAAAMKPKLLLEIFNEWGSTRPPDEECVSTLHLDRGFTEEAAQRFLRVYDATISFSGLAEGDKREHNESGLGDPGAPKREPDIDKDSRHAPPPPPPINLAKVSLMENERVVFAHELRPEHGFRLVVTGEVDTELIEALRAYADFQSKLVKKPARDDE